VSTRILAAATLAAVCLAAAPARADDGPALWEIRGEANSVFLFGSIHLLRPGEFRIDGALEQAYAEAEAIYMELDLDDLSPADMAASVAGLAVDPAGRSLDELMGEDAAEAQALARRAGIELSLLGPVEPWFAALTIVSMALAREGYSGAEGVEQLVLALAATDGKEVRGLESLGDQFGVLDRMDERQQRDFLLKSLEDAGRLHETVEPLLAAWRAGDDTMLARELETEFDGEPALYQALIVDRNRRWADQIEALLDDPQDYLVVVGALHLVGEDGLPAVLEARGVDIARR